MATNSSSGGLRRLIYSSRQRIPPADLEHEVGEIIRASIRNNRDTALTGLLLVHAGWFLQALEGPAAAVDRTYLRIGADSRHEACRVLASGPAAQREFGDWNMCARGLSAADDALLDSLAERQAFAAGTLDGRKALRLLKAVRGIQERTQLRAMI